MTSPTAGAEGAATTDLRSMSDDAFGLEFGILEHAPAEAPEAGASAAAPEAAPEAAAAPAARAEDALDGVEAEVAAQAASAGSDAVTAAAGQDSTPAASAEPSAPPRKLAAEYTIAAPDGTAATVDPDLVVSFTANGAERQKPLHEVVRLAQMGYYNAERETKITETEQRAVVTEQRLQQVEQESTTYRERLNTSIEAMLADTTGQAFLAAQERYLAQHTPEARAERAEQELHRVRAEGEATARRQQATGFIQHLAPKFEALLSQHPLVTPDELYGRFGLLTAPMTRGGIVPPEHFQHVDRLVDADLATYCASLQHTRADDQAAASAVRSKAATEEAARLASEQKLQAQTQQATEAKRSLARALKPGTGPAASAAGNAPTARASASPPPRPIVRAEDILDEVEGIIRGATA